MGIRCTASPVAALLTLLLLWPAPARAQNHLAVMGPPVGISRGELELGIADGSALGVALDYGANGSDASAWAMFGHRIGIDTEAGILGGAAQSLGSVGSGFSPSFFVGFSIREPWGPVWLKFTPNIAWGAWHMPTWQEALNANLPWLEVSVRPIPSIELGLRSSLVAPLRVGLVW